MGLTGGGTLACAVAVLVVVSVLTAVTWNRWHRGWRWPGRVVLLAAGDLAAVVIIALVLNSQYAFYPTWSDLFGGSPTNAPTIVPPGSQDAALRIPLAEAARSGHGLIVPMRIAGPTSHVVTGQTSLVYLPAVYGDPAWANVRFPVVELLGGYPGSPGTWTGVLGVQAILDAAIARHEMPPTVAVMPVQNVSLPRDTECANVVGGPQVDTYLTADVRTAITAAFRTSTSGRAWSVVGFSTGGYCAAVLSARHPTMFAAAVSIAGYNKAAQDASTGSLFGHDTTRANQADLSWWMTHRPASMTPLLLMASRQDNGPYHANATLALEAAAAGWPVSQVVIPTGGHNAATFDAQLPTALAWAGHTIGAALAPVPSVAGQVPTPVPPAPTHSHTPGVHRRRGPVTASVR